MESILDKLYSEKEWQNFLEYKKEKNQLGKREQKELESFILEKRFQRSLDFGFPEKKEIAKLGSSKKRVVYSYAPDETWMLKLLAFLLYRYDGRIPDSCYSFRRNRTAKTAFDSILSVKGLSGKYVLKLDIHDYFNSIDVEKLISLLPVFIDDDERLLEFLSSLLRQGKCVWQGEIKEEKRGAMAGVPLASFFANVYLADMDRAFEERGIPYCRYSDDIIVFLDSKEELDETFEYIKGKLKEKGLELNPDKYGEFRPGEEWTFLGFSYRDGKIDLAPSTVEKMKGKIRRKARKLYRWRMKKGASFERAARAMINGFDRKFYDLSGDNDFTWTRFYFPVISSAEGLKEIDSYMQKYLRYLSSGRHYKGNYKISYEELKKLGYTPLTAEYYRWKKENDMLENGTL